MDALYLISNAWGPKYGGINAFNTDFAKHLGLALGRRLKVGCIVLGPMPRTLPMRLTVRWN